MITLDPIAIAAVVVSIVMAGFVFQQRADTRRAADAAERSAASAERSAAAAERVAELERTAVIVLEEHEKPATIPEDALVLVIVRRDPRDPDAGIDVRPPQPDDDRWRVSPRTNQADLRKFLTLHNHGRLAVTGVQMGWSIRYGIFTPGFDVEERTSVAVVKILSVAAGTSRLVTIENLVAAGLWLTPTTLNVDGDALIRWIPPAPLHFWPNG